MQWPGFMKPCGISICEITFKRARSGMRPGLLVTPLRRCHASPGRSAPRSTLAEVMNETGKPMRNPALTADRAREAIEEGLETLLDDLLRPYRIDLSRLAAIQDEALLEHIRRVGRVFYQR